MSETIRAFIAVELPEKIISSISRVQENVRSYGFKIRWVRPESIHLTLKFLGNVKKADIEKVGEAIFESVKEYSPITLRAKGIGTFPGIKRPRVIWVGLGGQIQSLFAMQRVLEDNLAPLGFKKEKRPFKGHLTLGRFRQTANPSTIRQIMREYASLYSEEFTARRIILFKSDLKPTGAVYSQLQQAVLK